PVVRWTIPTSSRPGPSGLASKAVTSRLGPVFRCSWYQYWRSQRSSSCATSTNAGMKPDEHRNDRQGCADAYGQIWQHEPRPHLGAAVVVLLPYPVRDLFAGAAALHADHVAQDQRRDFGGDKPMVDIPSDTGELRRDVAVEPFPDVFPQFRLRFDFRRDDHHADQRAGGF